VQTNDRGSASINILRYGCKKYPTENGEYPESSEISNEYDCSSILNSLLSYGLSLYIPNGTFICTSPLYALEINLELSNNARLLYDGDETQYFIAVNTATAGAKTFITYRSRISGGIIDMHYKTKYGVCANRCVGLIFDNVIIQHFLREAIYLGSINPEIPEYVIETRVVNSTFRNFRRGSFTKREAQKHTRTHGAHMEFIRVVRITSFQISLSKIPSAAYIQAQTINLQTYIFGKPWARYMIAQ